jgi:uncharacterized protein (TIGR02996 family)
VDPREARLLADIAADPSLLEPYRVLADLLEERGDPRARLIRAQMGAAKRRKRETRELLTHYPELVGPWPDEAVVSWRYGFLKEAMLWVDFPGLREALAHPSARFLERFSVEAGEDPQAILDTLIAVAPPLRNLVLSTESEGFLDATALFPVLPRLESLVLTGWRDVLLGPLPSLTRLTLKPCGPAALASLLRSPLARLERLDVMGNDFDPATVRALAAMYQIVIT